MNAPTGTTFEELVRDIILLDDIMLSIKSDGAIAEVKLEKDSPFRVREQWATIGDEKGPWHVHVNIQEAKEAKFIIESSEDGRKRYIIRVSLLCRCKGISFSFSAENTISSNEYLPSVLSPDNTILKSKPSRLYC